MAIKISGTSVIDDNRKLLNHRFTTAVVTDNATATAGAYHYLDSAGITLTLPAGPSFGDLVGISDIVGSTAHTIGRNSRNVMGLAEDLTIDKAYAAFVLSYVDSANGWVFT